MTEQTNTSADPPTALGSEGTITEKIFVGLVNKTLILMTMLDHPHCDIVVIVIINT